MSGELKTPGGGITTLDFKVNSFIRLSGIMLLASLNKSVVKGREFAIASASVSKVHNDSSFRLVLWVFNKEDKMLLPLLIYFSHPILDHFCWLKVDFVHTASIHHYCPHEIIDHLLVHFCKSFFKFRRSSDKIMSLSDLRSLMFPLQPINLHKHKMSKSIFWEVTVSVLMALLCWISMWIKPHNAFSSYWP